MATPRAQVSMAGFYDWSTEEFEEVSVSSVYQKIAITNKNKYNKGTKNWCTDGVHVNPGRMFIRDKAELTKGEREIIAGIYKNRGDIHGRNGNVAEIKSHKDAWLVGKHLQKKNNHPANNCERCSIKIPEHLFSRIDVQNKPSFSSEPYLCDSCRDEFLRIGSLSERQYTKKDASGRKAPPSSPNNTPLSARKHPPRLPKTNAGEGAVLVESGKTFYDPNEGSKKKRVFVDVFLPKFSTPNLVEEPTNLSLDTELDAKLTISGREHCDASDNTDEGYSSQDKLPKTKHELFTSVQPGIVKEPFLGE